MTSIQPQITIRTDQGEIHVKLDAEAAAGTTENFLQYVDQAAYDGGRFYRTVAMENQPDDEIRIEVIQGGVPERAEDASPILLERTRDTGLNHLDGTISMARSTPDSATTEFFICIGAQPELDFGGKRNPDGQGFAAFGRVVAGMDVVRAIQTSSHTGQALEPAVTIDSIVRSTH